MKYSVALASGLVLGFVAIACSKAKDSAAIPSVNLSSCFYNDAKQCYEYYSTGTATPGADPKTICTESEGSWSQSAGCKTEGLVKGCQVSVSGVKVQTLWTYDAEVGPTFIEEFCQAGADNPSIPSSAQRTIVNP
ncbi:MAG: hypothetical protein RLZZ488_2394 [Pseudomonadota bacterium]